MAAIEREALVADSEAGLRLDQAAGRLFGEFSRARLQQWIRHEVLLLNGMPARAKDKVSGGDCLRLTAELDVDETWQANDIALDIVYEDEHLLVINKAAGLVVHPAAGHRDDTLVNGLLNYSPALASLPRAGIVHRLDKDTSGLLIVARTLAAHKGLVDALQARAIHREYQALVQGVVISGGSVDLRIGRHPRNRQKMAVLERGGREARTQYRVFERFTAHTMLQVILDTGRTHQIRVHMAHLGYPIIGDPVYGGRLRRPRGASQALIDCLAAFRRQALHAWRLRAIHPISGEPCDWQADPPADIKQLLAVLRADAGREE